MIFDTFGCPNFSKAQLWDHYGYDNTMIYVITPVIKEKVKGKNLRLKNFQLMVFLGNLLLTWEKIAELVLLGSIW
jgi:hypothetical protein